MPHDGLPQRTGPQAPPPAPLDPVRVQAIINGLADQRNAALDQNVNLRAEIATLQARVSMLEMVNKQLMEALPRKPLVEVPQENQAPGPQPPPEGE